MRSHAGRPVTVKSVEVPLSHDFGLDPLSPVPDWRSTSRPDGRTTTDRPQPLPDAGDGPDTLLGTLGSDSLSGRGGHDVIFGLAGNDDLFGRDGNDTVVGGLGRDTITGADGNDLLRGNDGDDDLTGGSGDDSLFGGTGENSFRYYAEDNIGNTDVYIGLLGTDDLLVLYITEENWFDATFQEELGDWVSLQSLRLPYLEPFEFTSLGLTIRGMEEMIVWVDDSQMDIRDQKVHLREDAYALNADTGVLAGNLLENDHVPDLVATIAIATLPSYGSVALTSDGSFVYTLDPTNPEVAALADGATLEDWFTYEVTDADGDTATATASVTIFDAPEAETAFGFVIYSLADFDYLGWSVSSAGDVNGDGIDDILIGSLQLDYSFVNPQAGAAYVIFGRDTALNGEFDVPIDLASLDGTDGFVMNGLELYEALGWDVSSAGDFNGDGIDDMIATSAYAENGRGATYVVFGRDTATAGDFAPTLDLTSLDGSNGVVLTGTDESSQSGYSVSTAGDLNGDGIDDIVIGSYYSGTFVVFGKDTATSGDFAPSFDLATLDGTNGFVLDGIGGLSVSSAGDINGDGIDDFISGSSTSAAVVFGRETSTDGVFEASLSGADLDGTNGVLLEGAASTITSVSSAGDVNGDGIGDVIVGATDAAALAGLSYVVFGRDTNTDGNFAASVDLGNLDGTDGFVLKGADAFDRSGISVASAGDLNGDGIDDILVGAAYGASDINPDIPAGQVFIVFGRDTAKDGNFAAEFDLSDIDGSNGFVLNGVFGSHSAIEYYDFTGFSVSSAGDVNGDGTLDIMIGAHGVGYFDGATYVVYGGAENLAAMDFADGFADGSIELALLVPEDMAF